MGRFLLDLHYYTVYAKLYIILKGESEYEKNNELETWRQELAGKSKYVKLGIESNRKHRKLKSNFKLETIFYLSINKHNLRNLKDFNQGRNSNGNARRCKYLIKLQDLYHFIKAEINLNSISQ